MNALDWTRFPGACESSNPLAIEPPPREVAVRSAFPPAYGGLSEADQEAFGKLGIPSGLLDQAGVRRVTDRQAREEFGIRAEASRDMSGIVFPYYLPDGSHRVTARLRRDHPELDGEGKPENKYICPYADRRHLYFPPGSAEKLADLATPIALVEAEKSALAITAWAQRTGKALLPLATGGCWGWRGKVGRTESADGSWTAVTGPLSDLDVCNGRTVFVALDANVAINDKVRSAQSALIAELRRRECRIRVCLIPQRPGVNGPDDLICRYGDGALAEVLESAQADAERRIGDPHSWPKPESLEDTLPDVAQFDLDLMPQSFRPLVKDVAERMQVPMDFPAVASIATLAGVTNRRALIQPKRDDDSWVVVPNLWGGIVAPPGMLKSPVLTCITQPARAIEEEWREAHAREQDGYNAALELQEEEDRAWRDQYRAAARKNQERPTKPASSLVMPTLRRLLTSDATFESLHSVLADNPAGLFVIRDELTGWLAGLERQGREQERAFYLECWNGDSPFTADRIGRGCVHVPHACISLLGGIQPARLRQYLIDTLREGPSDDGLIQRFQLIAWPDCPHGWQYVDRKPDTEALEHAARVYRQIASMDAASPLQLRFDAEAQLLFEQWLTELERRIRQDDLHPSMQAHLGKYRSLMPSLALLFALADGHTDCVPISEARLACDWCDYLETHAHRMYACQVRPERQAAVALSKRLVKNWKREEGFFAVRDVYRNGWNLLDTPDAARAALLVLLDHGWVRSEVTGGDKRAGRPSDVYRINPRIWRKHAGE